MPGNNSQGGNRSNGGGQGQQQAPAPEPRDTGIPSPFSNGSIMDAGNHFLVPGMEPEKLYKRINGKELNAVEAASIALAVRHDLDMPRFQFRKRTGQGDDFRYDGNPYEATVHIKDGKLRVFIPERAEDRGPAQGRGEGSAPSRGGSGGGSRSFDASPTGVETAIGPIFLAGNRYLIGDDASNRLPVYKEKSFRMFSPEEIASVVDASNDADRRNAKLKDSDLPVFEFSSQKGEKYEKRVGIDLQSGTMFMFDVLGRERDRGDQGRGASQANAPTARRSAPAPAEEPGADEFLGGGESTDGEEMDIPDEVNQRSEPAARRGRGR